MVEKSDLMKKLEKQKAELEARIRKERRAEAAKQKEVNKKRFRVMGDALAAELEENEELSRQLAPILDARIKNARDRKLLGLPPIQKDADA